VVATLPFFQYWVSADKMSVGAQMVVMLKAIVERCVSLVLGHPFEFSWLDVSQTDVFHRFFPCFVNHPAAILHLHEAANLYGNIPNEFPRR
jgi:hypothetical protein